MARKILLACAVLWGGVFWATTPGRGAEPSEAAQREFFEKNIRPVLAEKCYGCHSAAEKIKGGLALDTRAGMRKGGDTGAAVVPGDPGKSLLMRALRWEDPELQMPPSKSGGRLPAAVVTNFERWIAAGAFDPRGAETAGKTGARELWSLHPPRKGGVPVPKQKDWPRTDVDCFVLAAMEPRGLKPVGDSDPRALLRRVFCDLTGMPPNVITVDWFAAECAKGEASGRAAYLAIVDRLLASPNFGERWGRHWLDVARYAESSGLERNALYPTAWRYRDYVIASVNADKPYHTFIREQVAGDLLPHASPAQEAEHRVATAFLALGVKNLAEKNRLLFEMDLVDEQIDTVSRSVLGLTVACARCHNHKSDPITMNDYYGLAGIFRSTETCYGTAGRNGRNASTLLPLQGPLHPAPGLEAGPAKDAPAAPKAKKAAILKKRADAAPGPTPQELMHRTAGVREGKVQDSPVYLRGEVERPGPVVARGMVQAFYKGPTPAVRGNSSGRLELANWLASADNPLTARVAVNRVWQHLFGEGIVRTLDNFGATGEAPTHPELLDYLSVRFIEQGWSLKKLLRELVLSRTYQLSTQVDPNNRQIDPDNRMCWRAHARRLDAEALRDAMLVASGLLNLKPPGGSMVASIGNGTAPARGKDFLNAQFHYRSIYLPIVRDFLPSCLEVFDFAEPSLVVAKRDASNVPSQALYMMNNPFVLEQARALASRAAEGTVEQRVAFLYRATLCRPPTPHEQRRAHDFLQEESRDLGTARGPSLHAEAFVSLAQALLASAEFRYLVDSPSALPGYLP
jgi:hypothetical protein